MKIKITLEEFGGSYGSGVRKRLSDVLAWQTVLAIRGIVPGSLGDADVEVYWRGKKLSSVSDEKFIDWLMMGDL